MAENIDPEITMDVDSVEDSPSLALAVDEADSDPVIELEVEVPDYVSAYNAEAWAVGERGGDPVGSDDPAYHNNAKYYAEMAIEAYEKIKWLEIRIDCNNLTQAQLLAKYPVGTELGSKYTATDGTVYDCPWVVLGARDCEWEDGSTHLGLWIGMKYATVETIPFDAKEETVVDLTEEPNVLSGWHYWGVTGTSYTKINKTTGAALPTTYTSIKKCGFDDVNILKRGYNRWKDSAMRQWLNSGAGVGEWWTSQHTGDVAPGRLNEVKGFMAGLPSELLAVVHPVKVKTVYVSGVNDTTVDTFFAQSLEEMYGEPQKANIEGPYFPYWKQVTELDNPSNGNNAARKIKCINNPTYTSGYPTYLRSNDIDAIQVWNVNSNGGLAKTQSMFNNCHILPACVIS